MEIPESKIVNLRGAEVDGVGDFPVLLVFILGQKSNIEIAGIEQELVRVVGDGGTTKNLSKLARGSDLRGRFAGWL